MDINGSTGTFRLKKGLAEMLKGGVIMDVVNAEQAKVAFSTMLGSAEAGKRMFADLQKFAASTPLQLTTLQDASRTLLAFGVQGEQVIPTLRMLGDAAGGDAQRNVGRVGSLPIDRTGDGAVSRPERP